MTPQSTSSILATVALEEASTVLCGVFPQQSNTSQSLLNVTALSIRHQDWVHHTLTSTAEVDISALLPSASYDIYCMASSLDGMYEMALPNILRTKTSFILPCCARLDVNVNSLYTTQSSLMSDLAVIDIDQQRIPAGHQVHVKISVFDSSINASSLDIGCEQFQSVE